jgi:signal transduction histidine kinase
MRPANGQPMGIEGDVRIERLRVAFQQVPVAVGVTVVNAALMAAVLMGVEEHRRVYAWLAATVLFAAARLALWWTYRGSSPALTQLGRWTAASACGAFGAGLLWGGGSVLLLPQSETYQMFWVFLIGGMCAGATALHYAHLPTLVAFVVPASIPLAIRFALEGSGRPAAAATMIAVFVAALVVISRNSSKHFGEMLRLRFDPATRHAQKMEAVGRLTGGIAHDFHNLLTAVLSLLALLRKRLPADEQQVVHLLDNAIQGAERGVTLTRRLLAFGRGQALMPEVVDLPVLVHRMSTLLRTSVGPCVRVTMRFPEALPPVEVDAGQVEQALLNLATNARDAMPQGGDITIAAHEAQVGGREADGLPPGHYVVLSVADTGAGMDEAALAQAVEPFFTTKGVGKGAGLGLSMVHGFVAQSGGRFRLHSRKGAGTVAEIWLPRAPAAANSHARVRNGIWSFLNLSPPSNENIAPPHGGR